MKKKIFTTVFCVCFLAVIITGCGNSSAEQPALSEGDSQQKSTVAVESEQTNKIYGPGETWTVDGQWNLTFQSAALTDNRNQFSEQNPAQVVILTYSYENLGYQNDTMDLFISSGDMKVIDANKEMAQTYPATITTYPKQTPVGAICSNAEEAYGLNAPSDEITINIQKYDSNNNIQKATFKLPVQ